jgi:hypothetical protein
MVPESCCENLNYVPNVGKPSLTGLGKSCPSLRSDPNSHKLTSPYSSLVSPFANFESNFNSRDSALDFLDCVVGQIWLEVIESNNHHRHEWWYPAQNPRFVKLDIEQFQQFPRTVPLGRLECAKEFRR